MRGHESQAGGWFGRLRRIGEAVQSLARSRAELFAIELQEEKLRLINLAVWIAIGLCLGLVAVLVALGTLAVWLWEVARYGGLLALAAAALAAAVAIFWNIRRRIRTGPMPFAGTISEFRKDAECLRGKS